jgi:hypothetical protein
MSDATDPGANIDSRTYRDRLWANYFSALGRMFHAFAQVEDGLNLTIAEFLEAETNQPDDSRADINDAGPFSAADIRRSQRYASAWIKRKALFKAVAAGLRLANLRDVMKRLLRVTNTSNDTRREVDRIFDQLGEIQYIRDRLAHNAAILLPNNPTIAGTTNNGCWFCTSNLSTVKENEQFELLYFKLSMLLDIVGDLEVIPTLLDEALRPDFYKEFYSTPEMSSPEMKALIVNEHAPWRYKPSELKREGPKSRPTRQ